MTPPEQVPQRMGRGMLYLSAIGLLVILTWVFDGVLERRGNPNSDPQGRVTPSAQEVVLQRNRQGHYVATGAINGVPVKFLLDTGATAVAVPEHLARRLGLLRGMPQRMMTANGMITAYSTRLELVQLGPIKRSAVAASINPGMSGEEVLLGMSFLKHLEMRQQGNELTLRNPL